MDLKDILSHYADEFRITADNLKKSRDLKDYAFFNDYGEKITINSVEELKAYLRKELEDYIESIEDL